MDKIIEIKNATKKFKNSIVFHDITMNLERGKSYGFVGYNGCGKSVFFKCICGFPKLSEGDILYNGKRIGKDQDFIDNAGVLIETPEFINDLTGYKNLKIIAQIQNKISDDEILDIMNVLGLYEQRGKRVSKFSLGMKQKLRLAQALMERPEILILDEPMNSLDRASVELVRQLLEEHVNRGGTLCLTSHNRVDIEKLCKNVYEFDNGKLILQEDAITEENRQ